MASETTTTSANDPIFTSWVSSEIKMEQRPYSVSKDLFDVKGPGLPTKRYDWANQTDPGEASDLTEGTAMGNTELATGVASATAAADGQSATITKLLESVMVTDADTHFAGVLARSVAEAEENEAATLYGGFTTTVGTSGMAATIANFQQAAEKLETADATGKLVAVLHPVQTGDIRAATTATSNAHYLANPQLNQTILSDLSTPAGYVGELFGVDIYQTSAVTTANNGTDRAGAMFVKNSALGWYDVWSLDVQFHPDIQQPGTIVAATSCRGVVEVLDREGVSIITTATA